MDKLIIPKGCVIQGQVAAISNDGDIDIESSLIPRVLHSGNGGVRLICQQQDTECDKIIAEEGMVEVEANTFSCAKLSAQSTSMRTGNLTISESLTGTAEVFLKATEAQILNCSADQVDIDVQSYEGQAIVARTELVLKVSGHCKLERISAPRVIVKGDLQCKVVDASESVVVESGKIAIKSLNSPRFHAAPEVTGIVMVANSEEVKAEGVRGFLHPSELGMLADGDDVVSIPTADLSTMAMEATPPPMSVAEPEIEPPPFETPDEAEPEISDEAGPTDLDSDMQVTEEIEADDEPAALDAEFGDIAEPEDDDEDEDTEPGLEENALEEYEDLAVPEMPTAELSPDEFPDELTPEDLPEIDSEDLTEMEQVETEDLTEELSSDDLEDPDDVEDFASTAVLMAADGIDDDEPLPEVEGLDDDILDTDLELDSPDDPLDAGYELTDINVVEDTLGDDELTAEDMEVMEEAFEAEADDEDPEEALAQELTGMLGKIKSYFPDDNIPNSIAQIQRYIDERRFSLFAKARNKEAVISNFDKFEHQEISQLVRAFFERLEDYVNQQD